MSKPNKSEVIKARVSKRMKRIVTLYAEQRDETEAIIVREALAEYFARRLPIDKPPDDSK